jgi:hypothetical protein
MEPTGVPGFPSDEGDVGVELTLSPDRCGGERGWFELFAETAC